MMALPVTCTPATMPSQAAAAAEATAAKAGAAQAAIASKAGFTRRDRAVADLLPDRERDIAVGDLGLGGRVDLVAEPGEAGGGDRDRRGQHRMRPGEAEDAARRAADAGDRALREVRGLAQRGVDPALAGVHLGDLAALLHQHHQRAHAAGERDADVVELEEQHPALHRREPRARGHLPDRRRAALDRGDASRATPVRVRPIAAFISSAEIAPVACAARIAASSAR